MTSRTPRVLRVLLLPLVLVFLAVSGVSASPPPMPDAASDGLAQAADVSGQTVPVRVSLVEDEESVDTDDELGDEGDEESSDEEGEGLPDDEDEGEAGDDGVEALVGENHGAAVSLAAHECPPNAEHGACVREVARANHGHEVNAEDTVATDDDGSDEGGDTQASRGSRGKTTATSKKPAHAGTGSGRARAEQSAGGRGQGGARGRGEGKPH